jgi:phosphoenolpyruvate-protein kinase (PTS system EI component)
VAQHLGETGSAAPFGRPGRPARRREADSSKAAIFAAHQKMLGDPDLMDLAATAIDKDKSAATHAPA